MRIKLITRTILLMAALLIASSGCVLVNAPSSGPVTLRISFDKNHIDLTLLLDAYMRENPRIKIEVVDGNPNSAAVVGAMTENNLDIIYGNRNALRYMMEGKLLPLEDLLQDPVWAEARADFVPGSFEGLQIEGRQWGIPGNLDMFVVYINRDTMDLLGLETPPLNWTLDDFLILANNLNQPDAAPGERFWGLCTDAGNFDPMLFVYLMGGRLIDDINKPTTATFDDPKTIAAVQWYADAINIYKIAPSPGVMGALFRGGLNEASASGFCGTWLNAYSVRGGSKAHPWEFQWTMLPLPAGEQQIRFGDVEGYYVASESEHPEEALKLILYLTSRWESSGNMLPARRSVISSPGYVEAVGQQVAASGLNSLDSLVIIPILGGAAMGELADTFIFTVGQVVGGKDAGEALYDAQQRLIGLFD
ncbi:MAG: extracellular solute-binding protein [Chloroflexi bacterium]|nr:extracellular solute-binding protein [Chloroflexota bacterium]